MDPAPALYDPDRATARAHGARCFPALVPQQHGADTVLTGLLDRSALYGVLAEVEALGLDLSRSASSRQDRRSPDQVTAAHLDGH